MLSGLPPMVQAAVFNGALLDLFSPFDDCRRTSKVDICRRDVAEPFIIALRNVVLDEVSDLSFETPGR